MYLFSCGDCNANYVGLVKTLRTQICEQFAVSIWTGNCLAKPSASSIREHIESCNFDWNPENFKIIYRRNDNVPLRMSETYEVKVRKPNLNAEESLYPMLLV